LNVRSPYVGLVPFRNDNQDFFFGREKEIRILASNLYEPLTVFYGPSGAGKTSVLQAGVVPHQRKAGEAVVYCADWHAADFIHSVGQEIAAVIRKENTERRLDDTLAKCDGPICLLFDQFEEYLLYPQDKPAVAEFDAVIARIVNRSEVPARVLIAIRDDALSKLDQRFGIRIPDLLRNTFALDLLSPEAARIAITKPLEVLNNKLKDGEERYGIDDGLVQRIIDLARPRQKERSEQPLVRGVAPVPQAKGVETAYLQLVLRRLWDKEMSQGSRWLRETTLDEIGGASQMLAEHVREILGHLASEQEREIAARMFAYLVTPSGMKVPQSVDDLVTYAQPPKEQVPEAQVKDVLSRLAERETSRILRRLDSPDRYELYHDVLAPAVLEWCAEHELAQARTAERLAFIRELVAAANGNLSVDPERSLLLALYATSEIAQLPESDPLVSNLRAAVEESLFLGLSSSKVRVRFTGHTSRVSALAYSPEGKRVATVSEDGTARVWDAYSAEQICGIEMGQGALYGVAFEPRGKRIAAAAESGSFLLCDIESCRFELSPPSGQVLYCVAFHPDGTQLAVGDRGGKTALIPLDAMDQPIPLEAGTGAIYAVAFAPDGRYIAYAGQDSIVRLRDLRSHAVFSLKGHFGAVKALAFSGDGHLLASASHDGTARLWKVASRKLLRTFYSGYHWLTSIAFNADATLLATGGTNHQATIWDVSRNQPWLSLVGHTDAVRAVAFSPDGKRVATASSDGTARIWQVVEEEPLSVAAHDGNIADVAFSPDGRFLATASADKTAKTWDLDSEMATRVFPRQQAELSAVAFHPSNGLLTTAGWDRTVRFYDLLSGEERRVLKLQNPLLALSYSPDGRFLATADTENLATIWYVDRTRRGVRVRAVATCRGHMQWINAVGFSPDSKFLATSSDDKTIRWWEASSGATLHVFRGDDAFQGVAFGLAQDRLVLIGASHSGTAPVWDLESKTLLRQLSGHTKRLHTVACSPDGKRVATGSGDGAVKLWDLDSGREIAAALGHADEIWKVAFSPDGLYVASASLDRTVRIWRSDTGTEIKVLNRSSKYHRVNVGPHACVYRMELQEMQKIANRRRSRWLTAEECQQYLHLPDCESVPDPAISSPRPGSRTLTEGVARASAASNSRSA
jgi:WD40 repeat protein